MTNYHAEFCFAVDSLLAKPWQARDQWTTTSGQWVDPRPPMPSSSAAAAASAAPPLTLTPGVPRGSIRRLSDLPVATDVTGALPPLSRRASAMLGSRRASALAAATVEPRRRWSSQQGSSPNASNGRMGAEPAAYSAAEAKFVRKASRGLSTTGGRTQVRPSFKGFDDAGVAVAGNDDAQAVAACENPKRSERSDRLPSCSVDKMRQSCVAADQTNEGPLCSGEAGDYSEASARHRKTQARKDSLRAGDTMHDLCGEKTRPSNRRPSRRPADCSRDLSTVMSEGSSSSIGHGAEKPPNEDDVMCSF